MSEKLFIFDTTLRDGEQSPGASMIQDEKIRIAKKLELMNVDVIEAGFAIASKGDFSAVKEISKIIKNSTVCSLARALDKDIDVAYEALQYAKKFRIHTFIATSAIHMKAKLNMTQEQVVEQTIKAVTRARNLTNDVEFSPEDAGRSDFDFLCKIIEKAIDCGARVINIPDTVGYNIPSQFGNLFKRLIENIPNSDKAIFSVHCHNDLGLAVANSLSAVLNGARQIECTINGLGERAGNAALEEVVMAVRTRQDVFSCDTNINTKEILSASKLVSSITGFVTQPNKAIVGNNAFSHEAGIHQDGVIKHRQTYEIMKAEDVGWESNKLILGKHSGRNAFKERIIALGEVFENEEKLNLAFSKFKDLADKKHEIFDDDLRTLITDLQIKKADHLKIESIETKMENNSKPPCYAKLSLNFKNKILTAEAKSSGVVDAIFSAINKLIDFKVLLQLYSVSNVTRGTDSLGEVQVRLEYNNNILSGCGHDIDITIASAKAYIDGINKIYSHNFAIQKLKEDTI